MTVTEIQCIYLMNRMQKLGPVTYDRLLARYGTARRAWRQKNPPLTEEQLKEWEAFHEEAKEFALLKEMENLKDWGCRFLGREDPEFPDRLLDIYDCPIGIYVLGNLPPEDQASAGIIGARKCSEYGISAAASLGKKMAEYGIAVVSGMAMGIDSCSQWNALEAGGYSLAVLGSGIDVCYPSSSMPLYERLKVSGGIISEYGPGDPGLPFHFPLRNRLISALSDVILVLEARERSGTMITVDQALEQGKDVLALPGRIHDPLSRGCNRLIAQGAGILTGTEDVLRVLGFEEEKKEKKKEKKEKTVKVLRMPEKQEEPVSTRQPERQEEPVSTRRPEDPPELPEELAGILAAIGDEPVHQDQISRSCGIPLMQLFPLLWELEKRGLIRRCSSGTYIRSIF